MNKANIFLLIFYFIFCICPINVVYGLYEDQIGKFDWIQRYVGQVEQIVFDQSSSPSRRVIVSTSQNVIAALSTKSGDILWRHILEQSEFGKIEALTMSDHIVSAISGNLLRTWNVISAALMDEIILNSLPNWSESFGHIFAFGSNDEDLFLVTLNHEKIDIYTYDTNSGDIVSWRSVEAQWLNADSRCAIGGNFLVCLDILQGKLNSLNLVSNESSVVSQPLKAFGIEEVMQQQAAASPGTVSINNVQGSELYFILKVGGRKKLIHAHKNGLHLVKDLSNIQALSFDKETIFTVTQSLRTVTLQATEISSGNEVAEHGVVVELPSHTGAVQSLAVYRFARKDGTTAIRFLIACSDDSIHLISSAGVIWSREEGLSMILASEFVDLPVAGAEATFQEQLPYDAGIFSSFFHRIKSQGAQIVHWFNSLIGKNSQFIQSQHSLHRDEFNMRKLLIVITKSSKILALDNFTGDVVWSVFLPLLSPFKNNKFLLFTQRTAAHFPRNPQCVIAGKQKGTNEGLLYVFNPLTGEGIGDSGGFVSLKYELLQVSLLQQMDENYIKPLLLIDSALGVHVYPKSGEMVLLQWKHSLYVHLAVPSSSSLTGYSLKNSKPGALYLDEVWKLSLASSGTITGVYGKVINEKVHSAGRVLADRSVLYKYTNPNLVVVLTFGQNNLSRNTLTVHLVDTVTGSVLESVSHKRVTGPFHVVHCENWVVYTSYNEKFRRHEVTTLEMFEGLEQSNATAFSSFGAKVTPPILEKQTFIIPHGIQATSHTTTEKGITTKFILFALETGNVLQMSKWFLDPRRPLTQGGPREEGLVPYMPELPLPPQEMINHNLTLPRVTAIHTSPTGLESTCLVFVYGLDMFYTRVFPSKMFDVLKDDFDHYLIFGALLILTIAALVTRKLSQRKALKQAWK